MEPRHRDAPASRRSHLIVYAHTKRESFNHAILETAVDTLTAAGDSVEVSDLYAESFAPALTPAELARDGDVPAEVQREQERVARAAPLGRSGCYVGDDARVDTGDDGRCLIPIGPTP